MKHKYLNTHFLKQFIKPLINKINYFDAHNLFTIPR